jgi:hypothetical protein
MTFKQQLALATLAGLSLMAAAQAGDAVQRNFAQYSGFEGSEQQLGEAVAKTIMGISPSGFTPASNTGHDFSDAQRQERLGFAVSTAIKTINSDEPYMHEMNDALVKMTLTYIQFAKDHDLLDDLIQMEVRTQFPMLTRVGKMIKETGNQELALLAITDRTSCFYQLVENAQREPGTITFRSPYGNVLAQSSRIGQHDLTEKEIHEIWTIPRIKGQAELLGVDIEVSEWRDDGIVTISVPQITMAATTDQSQ